MLPGVGDQRYSCVILLLPRNRQLRPLLSRSLKSLAWGSWGMLAEVRPSTVEAIGSGNSVQARPLITSRPNMSLTAPLCSWGKVGVLVQHKRTKSSAMCVTLRLPGSNHMCHTTFHVAGRGSHQSRRMQSGRRCLPLKA